LTARTPRRHAGVLKGLPPAKDGEQAVGGRRGVHLPPRAPRQASMAAAACVVVKQVMRQEKKGGRLHDGPWVVKPKAC